MRCQKNHKTHQEQSRPLLTPLWPVLSAVFVMGMARLVGEKREQRPKLHPEV